VFLGGGLLVLADLLARILIAPVDIPVGIVTSLLGAPFFLFLLLAQLKKNK
jgi:iron complex transport system permease protein